MTFKVKTIKMKVAPKTNKNIFYFIKFFAVMDLNNNNKKDSIVYSKNYSNAFCKRRKLL